MRRVRPSLVRAAHAVALAVSVAAVALSLRESALFLPLLVAAAVVLVSSLVEWTSVPGSLRRVLPRAHALVLLTAGLVAWLSRSMSVLLLEPETLALVAAPVVVPMWAAFALAPRAFPAGRTLVPGVIAALTFAGLNPAPEGYGGSLLPFPRDGARNGFADVYLVLALLAMVALWTAALGAAGPRWSRRTLLAVALTGALAVGLAASAIVGLPLAQPHVEQAFAAALDQGATGLSGESTLGDIGALSLSRRRVLDLQTSPPSEGRQWRLPSEVFMRFDGRTWSNAATPREVERLRRRVLRPAPSPEHPDPVVAGLGPWFPAAETEGQMDPAGARVALRVTQAERAEWPLLLPRDPLVVTANASVLDRDRFGLIRRPRGLPLRQYGAIMKEPAGPALRGDGPDPQLSPPEREEALSLPDAVDPRLVSLAGRLAPSSAGADEKLQATLMHLQTGYRYSLTPGPFRPDGDPLAEFLFEKKEAYCEYFASAAVVLLRLQGVPARFVKGLSVGPQTDMGGGLHVVRESDAHAWVEVWIPGRGWIEADPTPPGQFASARGAPGPLRRALEHTRAVLSEAWARLVEGGPLTFLRWMGGRVFSLAALAAREPLFWLAGVALALGPVAWRRLRRLGGTRVRVTQDEGAVPAALRKLVRDVDRRLAAQGWPRPATRGRLEHLRRMASGGESGGPSVPDTLIVSGRRVVEAYYRARYGGDPPNPDEVRALRDCLHDSARGQ